MTEQAHNEPTSSEPIRLRLSCDACNAAKVRCSKTHPTCRRCAERRQSCVYGPSLRSRRRYRLSPTSPPILSPDVNLSLAAKSKDTIQGFQSTPPFSPKNDGTAMSSVLFQDLVESSLTDWDTIFDVDDLLVSEGCRLVSTTPQHVHGGSKIYENNRDPSLVAQEACSCHCVLGEKMLLLSTLDRNEQETPLDQLLLQNRDIMYECSIILECKTRSHWHDGPLLLSFAALLTKLILLLQCKITSKTQTDVRVVFGAYDLDPQMEQSISNNIIAAELAKIEHVLKMLKKNINDTGTLACSIRIESQCYIMPLMDYMQGLLRGESDEVS